MEKIKFNTGRKYAANGQPIVAVHIGDSVIFKDEARLIVGSFDLPAEQPLTQRAVMQAYDSYGYHMAAWRAEYDAEPKPEPEPEIGSEWFSLEVSAYDTLKARFVAFAYENISYGLFPKAEKLAAEYLDRLDHRMESYPADSAGFWANVYFDRWKQNIQNLKGEI